MITDDVLHDVTIQVCEARQLKALLYVKISPVWAPSLQPKQVTGRCVAALNRSTKVFECMDWQCPLILHNPQ